MISFFLILLAIQAIIIAGTIASALLAFLNQAVGADTCNPGTYIQWR